MDVGDVAQPLDGGIEVHQGCNFLHQVGCVGSHDVASQYGSVLGSKQFQYSFVLVHGESLAVGAVEGLAALVRRVLLLALFFGQAYACHFGRGENGCRHDVEPYAVGALREALPLLDRKLPGIANVDTVLTGVETRSSSPVRILRNDDRMSSVPGIYPIGEGAGYAGGIMSAAIDGLRTAIAVTLSR